MSNVLLVPAEGHTASEHHSREERRKRERVKAPLPVHVRLLDQPVEELTKTLDITRYGLCFTTSRDHYRLGMPLFLTLPYCAGSVRCLSEVVRVGGLPNGSRAVAVRFAQHCKALFAALACRTESRVTLAKRGTLDKFPAPATRRRRS